MANHDGAKHTACRKGKLVLITLKDGRQILDRFKERKGGTIILENHRFSKADLKQFVVYNKNHAGNRPIEERADGAASR